MIGLKYPSTLLLTAGDKLAGHRFAALCGGAEDTPEVASDSMDSIICADVIEHVPDVYAATAEMFRVLKPGRQILINTPNVAFAVKRLKLLLGRFPSTSQPNEGLGGDVPVDGEHLRYFTYRSLAVAAAHECWGHLMAPKPAP